MKATPSNWLDVADELFPGWRNNPEALPERLRKALDKYAPGWREPSPTPYPGPTDPPTDPEPPVEPPVEFPEVVVREVHGVRRPGFNVSGLRFIMWKGAPTLALGLYDNANRNKAAIRLVDVGTGAGVELSGDWPAETFGPGVLDNDGLCYMPTEKGKKGGVPVLDLAPGVMRTGRPPAHEICLAGCEVGGRAALFSSEQNDHAQAQGQWADTGEVWCTLPVAGAVVSAVPFKGGALCVVKTEARATVVSTFGDEIGGAMHALANVGGVVFAGGLDGLAYILEGRAWVKATTQGAGGRIMEILWHNKRLWFTTDKGKVFVVSATGGKIREVFSTDDLGYGWFGPRLTANGKTVWVSAKRRHGNGFDCAVWGLDEA